MARFNDKIPDLVIFSRKLLIIFLLANLVSNVKMARFNEKILDLSSFLASSRGLLLASMMILLPFLSCSLAMSSLAKGCDFGLYHQD
jgi:hypothetical protein